MAEGQGWEEELSVAFPPPLPSNVSSWTVFPAGDPYCDQTWFVLFQSNYPCGLAWEDLTVPGTWTDCHCIHHLLGDRYLRSARI